MLTITFLDGPAKGKVTYNAPMSVMEKRLIYVYSEKPRYNVIYSINDDLTATFLRDILKPIL